MCIIYIRDLVSYTFHKILLAFSCPVLHNVISRSLPPRQQTICVVKPWYRWRLSACSCEWTWRSSSLCSRPGSLQRALQIASDTKRASLVICVWLDLSLQGSRITRVCGFQCLCFTESVHTEQWDRVLTRPRLVSGQLAPVIVSLFLIKKTPLAPNSWPLS